MRTAWIKQLAVVAMAAPIALVTATNPLLASTSASNDRSFVAVSPARLLDTRPGQPTIDGTGGGAGLVAAGGTITVSVAGRGGVPANGVAAAVVNVTAVDPRGDGFITVFASGAPRPVASNLNVTNGQIVPNLVTTAIGPDGRLALYASTATHLVVDVMGWFPTGGTFNSTAPARLLDTRPGQPTVDGRSAGSGPVAAGGSIRVPVTARGGVPASGVGAVVVNATAVEPRAAGFVTVFAAGEPRPLSSNLNVVPGGIVANLVIASIGADGQIELFASATTHLVVDVLGWFPTGGTFHGTGPSRLLDTRPGQPTIDGIAAGGGPTSAGAPLRVPVTGRGAVPASGVGSVVVNVTSADARGAGFVSVYASGAPRPTASNLNVVAGQIVPNLVITAIGSDGRIELYASSPMHLIVDVMGWFPPDAASPPPPPAPADELWVVAGATAGGNGSTTRPFATLQAALDAAGPGNTIRLAAGDHRGKARTVRAGTEASPIRIVGSAGARLRHDGTSRLLEIDHSNITVEDLELSDANVLVTVIGAQHVRLLHNYLHDAGSECVHIRYQSRNAEIAGNTVRRCGLVGFTGGSVNGEALYIGTAPERLGDNPTSEPDHSDAAWVHHNDMSVPAECVDVKEDTDDTLIENNLCVGNLYESGAGFVSRGHRTVLRNNTSTGHLGSGIMLTGDRATDGTGSILEHNTLTNNSQYGLKNVDRTQARMCGNVLSGNTRGSTNPAAIGADTPC